MENIFTSGRFNSDMVEYMVVALPLFVGPETRMSPYGRCMVFLYRSSTGSSMPMELSGIMVESALMIRKTIFSPNRVGKVYTAIFISLPATLILSLDSCGTDFSFTFICASSFILFKRPVYRVFGGESTSYNAPSILRLILHLSGKGSTCMSV